MNKVLLICIFVLAVCIIFALVRVIKGPRLADRIVGVNMIGTMVDVIIIMLSIMLDESWLLDVAVLYTILSFLSVIVLTKVYMGVYTQRKLETDENSETSPLKMEADVKEEEKK